MIEAFRGSDRELSLFAWITFLLGFFVTVLVKLFAKPVTGLPPLDNPRSLEFKATLLVYHSSPWILLLTVVSLGILAAAYYRDTSKGSSDLISMSARMLYVLSFLTIIGTVSTAVFFGICKQ